MRCPIYQSKSIEKIRLVYSMQLSIVALIYMPQTKRLIRNPSRRRLFVRLTMIPSTSNLLLPLLLSLGRLAPIVVNSLRDPLQYWCVLCCDICPCGTHFDTVSSKQTISSSEGSADGIKTGLHGYEKMKISWLEVF